MISDNIGQKFHVRDPLCDAGALLSIFCGA
jgi:hypothetical protein